MAKYLTEAAERAAYDTLPAHCVPALLAYFNERRPVGDFLYSLLSNDLMATFMYADDINKEYIGAYTSWLYNYPPGRPNGWGSPKAVHKWLSEEHVDAH